MNLILQRLPGYGRMTVRDNDTSSDSKLTMHLLPGHIPDPTSDEQNWSYVKFTSTASRTAQKGTMLREHIDTKLSAIEREPQLARPLFSTRFVAHVMDC